MDSDAKYIGMVMCCIAFPAFVLQSVGFLTPKWVSNSECDSLGLFYHCCGGNDNSTCTTYSGNNTELDIRVIALQATSLTVMLLTCIGLYGMVSCGDKEDCGPGVCTITGMCCLICIPIAGILSITGGIVLAAGHSSSELGYSFALCITAGCYVVLMVLVCPCVVVCFGIAYKQAIEDGMKGFMRRVVRSFWLRITMKKQNRSKGYEVV